ncbi:hypothetical protein MBLNU457_g0962t1 [Dothideomycetes sp. NU457]
MASPSTLPVSVASEGEQGASGRAAPDVPQDRIVCIEHPCVIKDIDNGVKSLGGEQQLQKLLLPPGETPAAIVSLRPQDPFAKKLVAREAYVNNVLLRVVVPRKTGRKRKRGSNDPFTYEGTEMDRNERPLTGPELLQSIRNNKDNYSIEPVGIIHETHRFHSLPDFQMQAGNVPVFRHIANNLLDPNIEGVKNFKIDTAINPTKRPHIVAPPQFTQIGQPISYQYEQNPAVTTITNEKGKKITINRQKKVARSVYAIASDNASVPIGPPDSLQRLEDANKYMQQAVKNLKALLEERPIVTRRAAYNLCDFGSESLFKDATQYACYSFRSGPWKDALVKYGLDPRKDPIYRKYQTLNFQLNSRDGSSATSTKRTRGGGAWSRTERVQKDVPSDGRPPSHIFDGEHVSTNGKMWQVCDLTEPSLSDLLSTQSLRETCDTFQTGWYHNGTWCIARIIMRDQTRILLSGSKISDDDREAYRACTTDIPDELGSDESFKATYLTDVNGSPSDKVQALSTSIRQMAKSDLSIKAKSLEVAAQSGEDKSRKGNEGADEDEEGDDDDDDADGDAIDDIEMLERGDIDDLDDAEGEAEDSTSSPEND